MFFTIATVFFAEYENFRRILSCSGVSQELKIRQEGTSGTKKTIATVKSTVARVKSTVGTAKQPQCTGALLKGRTPELESDWEN